MPAQPGNIAKSGAMPAQIRTAHGLPEKAASIG
jgi:hypothetical protein